MYNEKRHKSNKICVFLVVAWGGQGFSRIIPGIIFLGLFGYGIGFFRGSEFPVVRLHRE